MKRNWRRACNCTGAVLSSYVTHFKHHETCKLHKYGVLNWKKEGCDINESL